MAAREAYFLYVERVATGATEADGPLSSLWRPASCGLGKGRDLPPAHPELSIPDLVLVFEEPPWRWA